MLTVFKRKSAKITSVERKEDSLYLYSERGIYRLLPAYGNIVRITYTEREALSDIEKPGVLKVKPVPDWNYIVDDNCITFLTESLKIVVFKKTASFCYYDKSGSLLLKERAYDSRELEEYTSYKIAEEKDVIKEKIQTADGQKEIVKAAELIEDEKLYHTRLHLEFQEEEALFGLGQHEEGYLNLRGKTVYVHQANKKIAIPMMISTLGYGILTDTYAPMIFNDNENGTYIYTEADIEMDHYFIYSKTMDGVIRGYRTLTGKASMLPKWAFGYIQSQERYETQDEILSVGEEYRNREIGLDCLVLDWCSWEDGKWGQKTFDLVRFSDPKKMVECLHNINIHFMISVWPNASENCEDYMKIHEKGLHLPCTNVYNAIKRDGRKLYWSQLNDGLFSKGVDAFWCDSSEPFTPEWNHLGRTEAAMQYAEYVQNVSHHLPTRLTNAYCLYHAQSIYEGQRETEEGSTSQKRVVNLTRSGYSGSQRYGTILWSGDISASWDTLKRQIRAGLGFCASGLPYWTVDIGAFFVKNGMPWYWNGNYDDTTEDYGYRELFVRWYQWGCFLPVFRGHGTDCRRELWKFGEKGETFYDSLIRTNRLRYELMPFIYSEAGKTWLYDNSIIKMLAFTFTNDKAAIEVQDQYLFGDSLMVCPVTDAMYYDKKSVPLHGIKKSRKVYLPKGQGWYDYWTNQYYEGGQFIETDANIDKIPLFMKEGSILPKTEFSTSVATNGKEISLYVYTGKDAEYTLYEDAGDGYGYEKGAYRLQKIYWSQETQNLSIEVLHNTETECVKSQIVNTIMIKERK